MNRKAAIVCLPLLAASLFAQGRGRGFGPGFNPGFGPGFDAEIVGVGPRAVVTGAPYSATETTTHQQTLAGGNTITTSTSISVARDSQGRISTIQTVQPRGSSDKPARTVQTIFDPVAGYMYRLNPGTMTALQTALPKPGKFTPPAPSANPNATTVSLGTMNINGVNATGTQVTVTIPAGRLGNAQPIVTTRTTWIATALQIPVEIKTVDPRFGATDMEVTNISQSEPAASLFAVPSNYTIQQGGGRGRGAGRGRGPAE